jgi:hypothetical protein
MDLINDCNFTNYWIAELGSVTEAGPNRKRRIARILQRKNC